MSRSTVRFAAAFVGVMIPAALSVPTVSAQAPDVQTSTVSLVGEAGRRVDRGGSATKFAIDLPDGASCPGDSKDGEYRVDTYMVPERVDPSSLQFASNGPEPQAYGDYETFRMPLFDLE